MTFPFQIRLARSAACLSTVLVAIVFAGCSATKLPAPTASGDVVEKLRAAQLAPSMVGTFALAPGKNPDMDRTLGGLRAASLVSASGSFSQQLKEELLVELKAAGLYDEKAPIVIEGQLTDSKVDAAISTGTGRLAARFTVTRSGQKVFDKELAVEASWESSFVGAIAIPAAINQYGALYRALVVKLIDDPDFRKALARS